VLDSYRRVGETSSVSWKLIQKIIHSFESLVIHEPKCVTYSEDFRNMDNFLTFVIRRSSDDNSLLKKASEQVLCANKVGNDEFCKELVYTANPP
jgi:hypothetical protein